MRSPDNGVGLPKKGSFDAVPAMSKGSFARYFHIFSYKAQNSHLRTILFLCNIMFAFYLTLKNGAVTLIVLLQRSGEIITPGAFRSKERLRRTFFPAVRERSVSVRSGG
jgi:hypothetical protein